jgi:hypothetical protein
MSKYAFGPQSVHFGRIHSFTDRNYRPLDEYGTDAEKKAIQDQLAINGWLPKASIDVFIMNDADKKLAMAQLEEAMALAKEQSTANENAAAYYSMMCKCHIGDNGKIIQPELWNNDGYRRLSLYVKALIQRQKIPADSRMGSEAIPLEIPVVVLPEMNEVDRVVNQVTHNEKDAEGRKDVSFVAKLRAARPLFQAAFNEAKLTAIFKRGTAQKLFGQLSLDARVPKAEFFDRCLIKDVNDPRYIPAASIDPGDVRKLLKDDKSNARTPTLEEVEKLIANAKVPGNKEKIADRNAWDQLSTGHPNPMVQMVAKGGLANNFMEVANRLAPLAAHCEELLKWEHKRPELLAHLKQFDGTMPGEKVVKVEKKTDAPKGKVEEPVAATQK